MIIEKSPVTYQENKNDELITARTIQLGLLPKARHFNRFFKQHFIIDIPLNTVSGDFYWVGEKHNLKYLVVGDCTGHGSSAALLSVLAINLFEYVIMNKGIKKIFKVLEAVDKRFIESFKDAEGGTFDNPWIDLSIICIDEAKEKVYFSSANRKLLYIDSDQNTTVYKGNKYPIGGWQITNQRDFKTQVINYKSGDQLYLGSDGFQDQIGGPNQKKYKSKKLHAFISAHAKQDLKAQKQALINEFYNWKKDAIQTDDICIVGIQL
ncbi:MAG: SpoIIE family protein phosphatase [Putridiphycobacter sp.]|nr:SpoIIE family protein phosphatase [Putridiphycobacter sp.]